MNILILVICMGFITSLFMICLIMICLKYNYYTDIILFFDGNNRNIIVPRRNISNVITTPKKEIELIPMKKYVVIQSPYQQFSIGIEVEQLSI